MLEFLMGMGLRGNLVEGLRKLDRDSKKREKCVCAWCCVAGPWKYNLF